MPKFWRSESDFCMLGIEILFIINYGSLERIWGMFVIVQLNSIFELINLQDRVLYPKLAILMAKR